MLILKNNWNPTNAWHANMDNGTIALWSKGRNFMPDAGVYTYGGANGLDAIRADFQKTCNHNTITRNLANIPNDHSKGKCLLSQSQAKADVVVTENQSYPDLTHRRAVYMVDKTFYVVIDEAYGDAAGVPLNLSFHLCDDAAGGKGAEVVKIDDSSSSFVYGAHTEFANGNNMMFRTFSETTDGYKAENGISYYSVKLDTKVARKYYRVNVNKKSASDVVRFITVIHPSTDATVAAEFKSAFSKTSSSVKVTVNGTSYDLAYSI
jgi:heparan-sulfate lyase